MTHYIAPSFDFLTDNEKEYIKINFMALTNARIAHFLGIKASVVSNYAKSIGLTKKKAENWSNEAINYLKKNYRTKCSTEIAYDLGKRFPRERKWSKKLVDTKLGLLNLKRTKADIELIQMRNWVVKNYRSSKRLNANKLSQTESPTTFTYFQLDSRTRIQVKPGTKIEDLQKKYGIKQNN